MNCHGSYILFLTLYAGTEVDIYVIFQVAGISQEIDARLVKKIDELVREGVSNVHEMKRHLKIFVKSTIFTSDQLPDVSNRRFFPHHKVIRTHMANFKRKLRHSLIDQDCLQEKIDQWKQRDKEVKIYFRQRSCDQQASANSSANDVVEDGYDSEDSLPCDVTGNCTKKLLFVYQNAWQHRLLNRYGNELVLLDATYRTTRYALPLFFLVVRTNVDYQVVGAFICETETSESIEEALRIFRTWNPQLKPKYCMTDYSNEEIAATENVFKGIHCFKQSVL